MCSLLDPFKPLFLMVPGQAKPLDHLQIRDTVWGTFSYKIESYRQTENYELSGYMSMRC